MTHVTDVQISGKRRMITYLQDLTGETVKGAQKGKLVKKVSTFLTTHFILQLNNKHL